MGSIFWLRRGKIVLNDLPQWLLDNCNATTRKPIQLLHVVFPNTTLYLSDREIKINGKTYRPWIENWGSLMDNVNIRQAIRGGALEVRTMTVSILSSASSIVSSLLWEYGIENVDVELYQWFEGESSLPVLIDKFIIQDQIQVVEAAIKFNIELVSPIMRNNPYVAGEEYEVKYPLVVGSEKGMPLIDLKTSPVTETTMFISETFTGDLYVKNATGFPDSGSVGVGNEVLGYDSRSNSSFHITGRGSGACTHSSETRVYNPNGNYDYAVSHGPVDKMENLLASGAIYPQSYSFLTGENPSKVRFPGKPPWITVYEKTPGETITGPIYTEKIMGASYESIYGEDAQAVINPQNVNNVDSYTNMDIVHDIDGGVTEYPYYFSRVDQIVQSSPMSCSATSSSARYDYSFNNSGPWPRSRCKISWYFGQNLSHLGDFRAARIHFDFTEGSCISHMAATHSEWWWDYSDDNWAGFQIHTVSSDGDCVSFVGESLVVNASIDQFDPNYSEWEQLERYLQRLDCEALSSENAPPGTNSIDHSYLNIWMGVDIDTPPSSYLYPYQECVSHFNRDIGGTFVEASAEINFMSTIANAVVLYEIVYRTNSDPGTNTVLWSSQVSSSPGQQTLVVNVPASDAAALKNARIGLRQTIKGPESGAPRVVSTSLAYVRWEVTWKGPDTVQNPEIDIVWADNLTVDVIEDTVKPELTPPEAIKNLLDLLGHASEVDLESFQKAIIDYENDDFYISGALERDIRLHSAIRYLLAVGIGRLIYNQGKIKYLGYRRETTVKASFDGDNIRLKSFREKRDNFDFTWNNVICYYDKRYTDGSHSDKVISKDPDSIARYSEHQQKIDLDFIRKESRAQFISDILLNKHKQPPVEVSFQSYMNCYPLEKGDYISFSTNFGEYRLAESEILSLSRRLASPKLNQINLWTVILANPTPPYRLLINVDGAGVDDSNLLFTLTHNPVFEDGVEMLETLTLAIGTDLPQETAVIDDSDLQFLIDTGYGLTPYGDIGYGN
jgi:hypothetical protein